MILRLAMAMAALASAALAAEAPRARVETGAVVGTWEGGAEAFFAIPYAAPPVGPLRWKPPAPAARWSGERAAAAPGPACPQPLLPGGRWNLGGYAGPISEDCLTLDVTAPAHARRAPVLVWVFGGGNFAGASSIPSYDARNFARDGVVVVAMNYRLGPLGFFAHPALTKEAPAGQGLVAYGLMDQIAALAWVKRNIAAFGGDPANVTLAGESAGGADVLDLMAIPAAWPLFRRAIVESGGGWSAPVSLAQREEEGAALAGRLCLPGAAASADQLRAVPAADLIAKAGGESGPAVDGRLMKMSATAAFARGEEDPVPLIVGSNSNEASLIERPGATLAEAERQAFNDRVFGAPARWLAARASARAPAWLYYFSYVPERQRAVRPGTNHASEIVYVFDSIDQIPGRTALVTPSERAVAAFAHACFTAFIKTGRPACAGWPRYTPAADTLMEISQPPALRTHFRKAELDALNPPP
jgi:para-nitrobenzyl esterase